MYGGLFVTFQNTVDTTRGHLAHAREVTYSFGNITESQMAICVGLKSDQ